MQRNLQILPNAPDLSRAAKQRADYHIHTHIPATLTIASTREALHGQRPQRLEPSRIPLNKSEFQLEVGRSLKVEELQGGAPQKFRMRKLLGGMTYPSGQKDKWKYDTPFFRESARENKHLPDHYNGHHQPAHHATWISNHATQMT